MYVVAGQVLIVNTPSPEGDGVFTAFVTSADECRLVALKATTFRSVNRAVGPETEIAAIALPCVPYTGAATHRMPA